MPDGDGAAFSILGQNSHDGHAFRAVGVCGDQAGMLLLRL
jgi:hypothetical protein